MNVLWLCNIPLPKLAEARSLPIPPVGGWMAGMANGIQSLDKCNLTVCFPQRKLKSAERGRIENIDYYAFPATNPHQYDSRLEAWFRQILGDVRPDLVHIFGTEFPHALAMVEAFARPDRTVIQLQGLSSIIAKHYMDIRMLVF